MSTAPRPSRSANARDELGFLAFSHGWTWLFWTVAGLSGTSVWEPPGVYFFYVGGAGVFLGGIVMSRVTYGSDGLRDLARRIVDPRPIAARWWAVILLFFPVTAVAAGGIAAIAAISAEPFHLSAAAERATQPAAFFTFVAFILVVGPLPEEIGWRGYLLDRLQLRWSALIASLLIAVIWWTWHLPLFLLPGYFDAFAREAPSPWSSLAVVVPSAILYTWIYNNTGRSVLAVILFHFMQNFTGEFLGIADEVRPVQAMLLAAAAVTMTLVWGAGSLRRDKAPVAASQRPGSGDLRVPD